MILGQVAERALDGAVTWYSRHPRVDAARRRFPWRLSAAVLIVPAVVWIWLEQGPASVGAHWLDRWWHYWNDAEKWARVPHPSVMPLKPEGPHKHHLF